MKHCDYWDSARVSSDVRQLLSCAGGEQWDFFFGSAIYPVVTGELRSYGYQGYPLIVTYMSLIRWGAKELRDSQPYDRYSNPFCLSGEPQQHSLLLSGPHFSTGPPGQSPPEILTSIHSCLTMPSECGWMDGIYVKLCTFHDFLGKNPHLRGLNTHL